MTKEKIGIGIVTCNREDFFNNAKSIVRNFFAVADIGYSGEVWCPEVNDRGDLLARTDCLGKAFDAGKKIAI